MDTILDWIKALPLEQPIIDRIIEETIKDKGENYLNERQFAHVLKNFAFCVLFVWNKTTEGFEYWVDINNKIPFKNGNKTL